MAELREWTVSLLVNTEHIYTVTARTPEKALPVALAFAAFVDSDFDPQGLDCFAHWQDKPPFPYSRSF